MIGSKVSIFKYTRKIYILLLNLEEKYFFNVSIALQCPVIVVFMSACGGQVKTSDIMRNQETNPLYQTLTYRTFWL